MKLCLLQWVGGRESELKGEAGGCLRTQGQWGEKWLRSDTYHDLLGFRPMWPKTLLSYYWLCAIDYILSLVFGWVYLGHVKGRPHTLQDIRAQDIIYSRHTHTNSQGRGLRTQYWKSAITLPCSKLLTDSFLCPPSSPQPNALYLQFHLDEIS